MARLRTLTEAIRHIQKIDPATALTHHALRVLVLSGEFRHVSIGKKRLVDIDLLEKYLSGEYVPPERELPQEQSGTIRRLS